MAKHVQKSGLVGKLGNKGHEAFEEHKGDETVIGGGGSLPPGIDHGVAQLVDCRFSQYKEGDNAGEYFWLAAGIVVAPKMHNQIPVEGLRTQIMEPMCDTPNRSRKTVKEHMAWVLNEMRKLGLDTNGIGYEELESSAAVLKEAAPYFRYRTWQGEPTKEFPNPRVNEQWRGQCDFEPSTADDVVDNTEAPAPARGRSQPAATAKASAKATATKAAPAPVEVADDEELVTNEEIMALGATADAGGDDAADAAQQLTDMATDNGIDPNKIETWTEVAEQLCALDEADSDEGGGEEPAADEPAPWEVEQVCYYKPPRAKKAVECEITHIFKNGTCNVKDLSTSAIHKGVKVEALQESA